MAAKFIPVGEPAHDAERQALRFLVEGLPDGYIVYGNPWVVEHSGTVYEIDAVVVAPHAIFAVEIKSYRGAIEGTDHDWWVPERVLSPIKLNRKTAQVLHAQLKHENVHAGRVWVQGFVFLSATTNVGVRGPASLDRIHTRKTILAALQDNALVCRLSRRRDLTPSSEATADLHRLLTGTRAAVRPARKIREYEITGVIDRQDTYAEYIGRNALSGDSRVLRVYAIPPLATDEQRRHIERRVRWEAQVLARIGQSRGILSADPPFVDEAGTGLSRTTLWRLECRGQFSSSRQLTTNTVGWLEAEVEEWIATRVSRWEHHAK